MKNTGKIIALITMALMLCNLSLPAVANTQNDSQAILLQDGFDTSAALAYGLTPEHLYPFIYPGRNPYPWIEIDTDGCVLGKLYVYNENTNVVTPIGTEIAKTYAATADYLYYVTSDQSIVKTDYTGSFFTTLYNAPQGNIHNLSAFGNILYFIEEGKRLKFLDTATGNIQLILTEDEMESAVVFNEDKVVWYNNQGESSYYNITTKQSVAFSNQYEANALITYYIMSDAETVSGGNTRSVQEDPYNDVTFPLAEYPAVAEVGGFVPNQILSRFRYNDGTPKYYAGSNECDGFAKYAFDKYWHLYDANRTYPSWVIGGENTDDVVGIDDNIRVQWYSSNPEDGIYMSVEQFFRYLGRGSFVRYVSRTDSTPENGTHSIVFDKFVDGQGIWVYEANMDGDYGVGYQLYPFGTISGNYKYIMYYVEHNLSTIAVCDDLYRHRVYCVNCDGYLRQEHTPVYISYNEYSDEQHMVSFDCCNGETYEDHDFSGQMIYEDEFGHIAYCVSCNEYEWQEHPYDCRSYVPLDSRQHIATFECCGETVAVNHYVHNYRCLDCGMSMLDPEDPGIYWSSNDTQR